MSEYVFRYASGYGCKPGEYERENGVDHYGTLHEEIVRCRDCSYFTHTDNDWCVKHGHIGWSVNGFCAWACRKEVGE